MSMPKIPEELHRPSLKEVTLDLLKAVALEETALSHILNAEGERTQAIIKRYRCCPCEVNIKDLLKSISLSEKILSDMIMKEWLLLKQFQDILEIAKRLNEEENSPKNHAHHVNNANHKHEFHPHPSPNARHTIDCPDHHNTSNAPHNSACPDHRNASNEHHNSACPDHRNASNDHHNSACTERHNNHRFFNIFNRC